MVLGTLKKGGGYLLSRLRSIISVIGLNCSVRNGKRWNPDAITTLYLSFRISFPYVTDIRNDYTVYNTNKYI